MQVLPFALVFIFALPTVAQNLVLNPGFEEFTDSNAVKDMGLNSHYGFCHMAMDLQNVSHWTSASEGTPDVIYLQDIYHTHSGRGIGRALVTGDHIEYLQGILQRPLRLGEQVFVQLWVALEYPSSVVPAEVGICFHANRYREYGTGFLNAAPDIVWSGQQLPQQFETWMLLTGTFTAKGKEQYFTIGNFKPLPKSKLIRLLPGDVAALLRMDDVSITSLRPLPDSLPQAFPTLKPPPAFVPENVLFNTNEAVILPGYESTLNKLTQWMLENPEEHISIEGHTDNAGTAGYNLQLSLQRATSVKAFLVQHSVPEHRIAVTSYGEIRPRTGNDTEEGKALNRRIEVKVL